MPTHLFDRFTGLAYAREALARAQRERPFGTAAVLDEGKNGWVVRRALLELGVEVVNDWPWNDGRARRDSLAIAAPPAEALVIGTMSPGPMLDSWERRTLATPAGSRQRLIAPWVAVTDRRATPGDSLVPRGVKVPA
jgi:hypothetical protein